MSSRRSSTKESKIIGIQWEDVGCNTCGNYDKSCGCDERPSTPDQKPKKKTEKELENDIKQKHGSVKKRKVRFQDD